MTASSEFEAPGRRNGHATAHINGSAASPLSTTLLENVDVNVETYLGETLLTVSELKALKAGSIVTLNAALNEIVELRVNGVKVAYGELVAVGDRFGVRVISVAP